MQELLLIGAVVGVGILHTMVPDHWVPIALLARQRGWSRAETAKAALQAGSGHVLTTLLLGVAVWLAGAAAAERFGAVVDSLASDALVAFGLWIAIGAWRELQGHDGHGHVHPHDHGGHGHGHGEAQAHDGHGGHDHPHAWEGDRLYAPARGVAVALRHAHAHRHGGSTHLHWHDHASGSVHAVTADMALSPPPHVHRHRTTGRTALLLLLGSSPMVEGIPAFFAAARYGAGLIALMSLLFAASTIGTYVVLSVYSASGLQRLHLGPVERYGEVISGAFIAAIGLIFGIWSLA